VHTFNGRTQLSFRSGAKETAKRRPMQEADNLAQSYCCGSILCNGWVPFFTSGAEESLPERLRWTRV